MDVSPTPVAASHSSMDMINASAAQSGTKRVTIVAREPHWKGKKIPQMASLLRTRLAVEL